MRRIGRIFSKFRDFVVPGIWGCWKRCLVHSSLSCAKSFALNPVLLLLELLTVWLLMIDYLICQMWMVVIPQRVVWMK